MNKVFKSLLLAAFLTSVVIIVFATVLDRNTGELPPISERGKKVQPGPDPRPSDWHWMRRTAPYFQADAEYLTKDLLRFVHTEDLICQSAFQAFVRIGRKVARIHTYKPLYVARPGHRDEIIERSRTLYCKPVAEVVAANRHRPSESG